MQTLLTISNGKTLTSQAFGVMTGILHLSPASMSGTNLCPKASAGCKESCLNTAGRGVFKNVANARDKRSKMFNQYQGMFMEVLADEISKLAKKASKKNMSTVIRLNGTSDITWEKIKVEFNGVEYLNIMAAFPDIEFYDYTKILGRKRAIAISNYHLTFSLAEDNDAEALRALDQGYNVAVVVDLNKKDDKPATWGGYPTIDGDITDMRYLDPKGGHVVLLTAKGKARKDESGFVRSLDSGFIDNLIIKVA